MKNLTEYIAEAKKLVPIEFHNYSGNQKPVTRRVNVVYENHDDGRLDVIIVEKDGYYQDYYENNGYKVLTESGELSQEAWDREEVGLTMPEEFIGKPIKDFYIKY